MIMTCLWLGVETYTIPTAKKEENTDKKPYEHFEDYYHLHLNWLKNKYNNEETRTKF